MKKCILLMAALCCAACGGSPEPVTPPEPVSPTEPVVIPEPEPFVKIAGDKSFDVPQEGETLTLSFETAHPWVASSSGNWVVLSVESGEAGQNRIDLQVKENDVYDQRECKVFVESRGVRDSVLVCQRQRLEMQVTADTVRVEAAGGTFEVEVLSNIDYVVNVQESAAGWMTTVEETKGLSASSFSVSVSENLETVSRHGELYVVAEGFCDTVRVEQAAADSVFRISKTDYTFGSDGGTAELEIESNLDYEISVPEEAGSWISYDGILSVLPNASPYPRNCVMTVSAGSRSAEINVSQRGVTPVFNVEVSDQRVPANGGSFKFKVETNLELKLSMPSWITCDTAEGEYTFSVSKNNGSAARSDKVSISDMFFGNKASFTVSQKSTGSLYILAIGNSFSSDAMEYLGLILKEMGYTDVFLGNLYIGGCTLQTHAANVESGNGAYQFRTTSGGSWSSTDNYSSVTAMKSREWDYVSVQQASGLSGKPESYDPYLSTIMKAVKQYCPNAKRMWHMTWAYQGNSSHSDFGKYGNDQMTMYNAIVNAVKTKVLPRGDFDFVIPSGTVVQNLRTSFIGDNITRDGYHMSYDIGRFATAPMWARQITGKSIEGVAYRPSGYSYSDKTVLAIKEAVENAYKKPFEVTESEYPPVPVVSGDAEAIIAASGYDPANYTGIDVGLTHNGFYNSTSGTPSAITTNASNSNQFAATRIFSKTDIPAGSLIVLKAGFQYRPEGWISLSTKNSSSNRPGNVTSQLVEVDSAWWGSWNYRAFNVAKAGNPNLDAAGQAELDEAFFIYVPKN